MTTVRDLEYTAKRDAWAGATEADAERLCPIKLPKSRRFESKGMGRLKHSCYISAFMQKSKDLAAAENHQERQRLEEEQRISDEDHEEFMLDQRVDGIVDDFEDCLNDNTEFSQNPFSESQMMGLTKALKKAFKTLLITLKEDD